MTMTNYGNKYKFAAIMKNRSHTEYVMVQGMRKDGTWGKPVQTQKYGKETDEDVVKRLIRNNNKQFRLAE